MKRADGPRRTFLPRRCGAAPALLALLLLLRALVPVAQALPSPGQDAAAGAPWGGRLVICSALGADGTARPDGPQQRGRQAPSSDCLVCQGLALGQAVLPQAVAAPDEQPLERAVPPSPRDLGAESFAPSRPSARAPPLPLSLA